MIMPFRSVTVFHGSKERFGLISRGCSMCWCSWYLSAWECLGIFLTYAIPYFINDWKYKILSVLAYCYLYTVFKVNMINRPIWYGVFLILLVMCLFDNPKMSGRVKLLLFVLLGGITANIHAGMIVVISAVLLLNVVGELFFSIRFGKRIKRSVAMYLLGDVVAFFAGYMINPLGPYRLVEMLSVPSLPSTSHIPEWNPITISGSQGAFVLVLMAFAAGFGFCYSYRKKDVRECRHVVVVSALICLGIMSQKSGVIAIVFFMTYAYKYIEIIIDEVLFSGTLAEKKTVQIGLYRSKPLRWLPMILVVAVALIIAIPYSIQMKTFEYYVKHGFHPFYYGDMDDNDKVLEDIVSQDILDYLKIESVNEDFSVLNSYIMGNYLVWERIPTFVDSRQYPYAEGGNDTGCTSFDDLISMGNASEEEFQEFLDYYDFKFVIVGNSYVVYNGALTRNMDQCDNYELIMYDEASDCSLYQRVD